MDIAYEVAHVSAPANALSPTRMASSQPTEIACLNADSACGGPIVITVTFPPTFSLSLTASSMAYSSKGFIIASTPSLFKVPFSGSI